MEIERMYSEFLDSKNDDYKEKYKGLEKWFSASSAGSCYKKHMFKVTEAPQKEMEARSQRIMRLGTLVHKDFEDAVKYYIKNKTYANSTPVSGKPTIFYTDDHKFYIEHRIKIPEYNVLGHLDFAVFTKSSNRIVVYDYKTSASYKWRLKFGRIQNRDKNPSFNYEMQLSTYLLGMEQELDCQPEDKEMSIIWYNKDTSRMREERIRLSYVDMAHNYWQELNEIRDDIKSNNDAELTDYENVNQTLSRHREMGVPFQDWECKYCPYEHICR
jgi:CRISPR/Cas system-associated exonuclease Cas4 (RecB family)